MKFKLDTIRNNYRTAEWEKLAAIGLRASATHIGETTGETIYTKDDKHEPEIEITAVEQLVQMVETFGDSLIVSKDTITIYDGYAE